MLVRIFMREDGGALLVQPLEAVGLISQSFLMHWMLSIR
jgi:hypothetical protein